MFFDKAVTEQIIAYQSQIDTSILQNYQRDKNFALLMGNRGIDIILRRPSLLAKTPAMLLAKASKRPSTSPSRAASQPISRPTSRPTSAKIGKRTPQKSSR